MCIVDVICDGLEYVENVYSFFFNDTATTEIYTLSLHDALPISTTTRRSAGAREAASRALDSSTGTSSILRLHSGVRLDRKSTRLNSSHANISYAVFCLKKKNNKHQRQHSFLHFLLKLT